MDINYIRQTLGDKVKNFTANNVTIKKAIEGVFEQAKDIVYENETQPMSKETEMGLNIALGIGIFFVAMIVTHSSASVAAVDGMISGATTINIENLYYYAPTP